MAALEARFWDTEAVAAALAREVEELLAAYDDVVCEFGLCLGIEGVVGWFVGWFCSPCIHTYENP